MSRFVRWTVGVAIVAAVAAGLWLVSRPDPVEVAVVEVIRGSVEATVVNTRAGTIMACQRARMSPQIGGRIARLPAREGEAVKKDQLLLELWNDDLSGRLRLARREQDAAAARAEQACLSADLAGREAARTEKLFSDGVVDESAVDRARGERDSAAAACRAAQATAEEAVEAVTVATADLAKTRLLAPFDGVIADVNGEVGEFVTPSPPGIPTPPVVDLLDPACLYVEAPIDEVDAPAVRLGMTARVTLDAFRGRSFDGVVTRIDPFVLDREKQARTVDVEIRLRGEQVESELLPGYTADAEILIERREDVLRIPTEAVRESDRVLVLEGETLVEREVELGLSNWEFSEVLEGLEPGDLVVTSLDRAGVRAGALATAAGPGD